MWIDFSDSNFLENFSPNTDFEHEVKRFIIDWQSTHKTVSVQTSGSTGTPKIFEIEKERMQHSARMTCDFLDLSKGDTALLCLPVVYISGKMMIVRALERKLKLYIADPSIAPLQHLDEMIDFCALTPLQVEHSLEKLKFLKNLIIGGAAVSELLKKKIIRQLGKTTQTRIYETYGMSETLSHIALKEIYPHPAEYFNTLEHIKISLDARGCLCIEAPDLNKEKLHTNDLVEILNEKQFRFLGRIDHVINSGGAKIFPETLEAIVKRSIENEVVFLGIPDDILGNKLIMVIEGFEDDRLRTKIKNLPFEKSFHQPKAVYFLEKFPRTPNGKVNRKAVLEKLY